MNRHREVSSDVMNTIDHFLRDKNYQDAERSCKRLLLSCAEDRELAYAGYSRLAKTFHMCAKQQQQPDGLVHKEVAARRKCVDLAPNTCDENHARQEFEKAQAHREKMILWADAQFDHGVQELNESARSRRKKEKIEQAIEYFQLALRVLTEQCGSTVWARTQNNLGIAYSDRIEGEERNNIEQAIKHYGLSLQVHTQQSCPMEWAATQNNLGTAYSNRIEGEK
jgi:tetratricopeptide (TPR) repeat protein